ncbi:MAG: DUF4199 domain-containing protein [Flammeovirgaceae bacterium]|nr:DUF4199 domain-containing protein [Flammeovirgaceae bacterium]MDW8287189.1 DUF4199 domain-containing protein [Flammeovirgaceae bacterium]
MIKVSFTTALFASFSILLYFLILDWLSLNPFGKYQYLYFGLYGIFFVAALKYFRDRLQKGTLRYRQGIALCLTMNFLTAMLLGMWLYAYMTWLDAHPLALETHKKELYEHLKNNEQFFIENFGKESYQTQLTSIPTITASLIARDTAMRLLIAGFLMSFIFTAFFRKKTSESKKVLT